MKTTIRITAALVLAVGLLLGSFGLAGAETAKPEDPWERGTIWLPAVSEGAVIHVQNLGAFEARFAIAYEYGDPTPVESGWINPGSSWTFIPDASRVAPSPITGISTGSAFVVQIAPTELVCEDPEDLETCVEVLVPVPFGASVDRVGVTGGEPAAGGGNSAYTGFSTDMLPDIEPDGYWLYAPVVHKNFNGWNSILRIQNAQDVPAQLDIWFYDVVGNPVNTISNLQLAAALEDGCSIAIDPAAAPASLPDGTYSAWIRVTGLDADEWSGVAAVVDEYKDGLALTYRATAENDAEDGPDEPDGETGLVTQFAPLVFKAFNDWNAGIRVTNIDPNQHGLIKVTFRDMDGTAIATYTDDIDRRSFKDYFFADMDFLPQNFVGSATVESQHYDPAAGNWEDVDIISVVQQTKWVSTESYPRNGMAYNTADYDDGSDLIGAPFLSKYATSGFSSGMQIMNINRSPGWTDVHVELFTAAGPVWGIDFNLEAWDSKTVDLRNIADDMLPQGFVGSGAAWGFASTQDFDTELIGVVNEVSFYSGLSDGGKAYEMYYAPDLFLENRLGED